MICPELPTDQSPGSMAPGARQIQSIAAAGVDVQVIDMRGIPKLKYLQVLPKVRRAARNVDLIHAHFGYCGWLAWLGKKWAGSRVPIVMSFMGDDLLGTPANEAGKLERASVLAVDINRRMASRYDQIIVKSQEMAEQLRGMPCHVIPNGVDLDVFRPVDRVRARQELGWSESGWRVLFPGDPSNPRKGHSLAQAAVRLVEESSGQPVELVPLWGVHPDQVPLYMNACNAMLMTSLIEGSPNVVKEALACNANVVAVPVGDVPEMLQGIQQCQTTARAAGEIGAALERLLRADRPSDGRDVLQTRGLSLAGVAQRILGIYRRALQSEPCDAKGVPTDDMACTSQSKLT